MKIEIEIPDEVIAEVDVAVAKHDARAAAESMPPLGMKAVDLIQREAKGWVANFILSEHHQDLNQQTEELLRDEGTRLKEVLSASSLSDK